MSARSAHATVIPMRNTFLACAALLLLIATAAGQAPADAQRPAAGPKWYQPAAPTGVAVEAAILAAYRTGGRVYLPGGNYLVGKTIELTHVGPVLVEGEAFAPLDGWRGRGGVMLTWTGEKGGTMMRLNTMGLQLKNVTLNGNQSASVGIQLWSPQGWGSALNSFEHVIFNGFTSAGFQAGLENGEPNSADVFFDRCAFTSSAGGFKVVHSQGVNFHFDRCQFGYLKTAIQADFGGGIYVRGGGGGYCDTFLRTGEGGHNTGPFTIRDFRFEIAGYTRKWGQMLDAPDSPGGTRVVFDALHLADGVLSKPDAEISLLEVGAGVSVRVRDSVLKRPGAWPLAQVKGKQDAPGELLVENTPLTDADAVSIVRGPHARVRVIREAAE